MRLDKYFYYYYYFDIWWNLIFYWIQVKNVFHDRRISHVLSNYSAFVFLEPYIYIYIYYYWVKLGWMSWIFSKLIDYCVTHRKIVRFVLIIHLEWDNLMVHLDIGFIGFRGKCSEYITWQKIYIYIYKLDTLYVKLDYN